jgi:GNAT superfamily N-acetyltransferase
MSTTSQQLEITGHTVTIRPMCREDAEMENDFVRRLSPQAKHYRFLGAVKELSPPELKQFCDVDGHRSMAFVATVLENGWEMQIGVSRYAPNVDGDAREIAITVADDWQHHGLGTRLAQQLIRHARERGVRKLYSVDLADNSTMRALARDLGMTATPDPEDARQVIYSLALSDDRAVAQTE